MKRAIHEAKAALMEVLRRPIAYHVVFAKISGGVTSGVFLSQLFYWADRGKDPNGWIYKTQAEWEEETGLTRWEQETARKRLKERGILEEKRAGMPARLYYRLDLDRVIELAAAQSSMWDSHNQECGNSTDKNVETPQSSSREPHNQECGASPNKSGENPQTSSRQNHQHAETTTREYKQQQQADADAKLSEDERQAFEALRGLGFPESDARRYARDQPMLALSWSKYARGQEGLRNPGGFVRKRLDAGDSPPEEPNREAPPPPTGTVYT